MAFCPRRKVMSDFTLSAQTIIYEFEIFTVKITATSPGDNELILRTDWNKGQNQTYMLWSPRPQLFAFLYFEIK